MTKFEKQNYGVFATQYSIYEDDNYIGECFGYAQDLCVNEFNYILTWCFFLEPKEDLITFIQEHEEILTDDIDKNLKMEFEKYSIWNYETRVIVKGNVIELDYLGTNF